MHYIVGTNSYIWRKGVVVYWNFNSTYVFPVDIMPVSIYALASLVRCASDTYCPPLHFIWHCVISVLPSVVLYVYSNGLGVQG